MKVIYTKVSYSVWYMYLKTKSDYQLENIFLVPSVSEFFKEGIFTKFIASFL